MVYTMYIQALGIYMVYTWYIVLPCIIFLWVPDGPAAGTRPGDRRGGPASAEQQSVEA